MALESLICPAKGAFLSNYDNLEGYFVCGVTVQSSLQSSFQTV